MSKSVFIYNALCLPAPDTEALIQGRIIAAMPRKFINPGQIFGIYPANISINLLPNEKYYRPNFLNIAQTVSANLGTETALIKAWAKCEVCQMLNARESIEDLSKLTIWTTQALQQTLAQRPYIFLAYLRVYLLPEPQEIDIQNQSHHFVPLPRSLTVTEDNPVLSDRIFAQRRQQLEKLEPLQHEELEELQSILALLAISNPVAKKLDDDIQIFLGWKNTKQIQSINTDLAWINDIAKLGDRSIELDEKKSNYQAGTDFENITRQSLEFLGFKVEDAYKGGAGGLDLFCSQPYPLLCECKAGRLIPSHTVQELIKLGGMHLGSDKFLLSTKLVIGPGNPSADTLKAAQEWKVSIINAMTLQKLVEFSAKYPGAINLIEIKKYLEPGQIDYKIGEYIDKVEQQIKLRSHIIQVLRNYLERTKYERAGVEALHAAYMTSDYPQALESKELHEILIELSSPLTGYLGRVKGSDWRSDRFYYLRDLPINSK
ncbi:conserved hypothetical protein [Trichormus variabilis ATCC 29413]|uniref:DUF1802 domain-containing protein n=2 Tax=Anabaena variabilis TaxID=264691 RepID=Q3MDR2_TRIV2|nr:MULTISPECIES: DUF1802 family protein [Nostocaceae]ABA20874.1 conserved hypothetical protein [Trichormus variabilis ATCC 29413]MBC1216711.1 DUF1802 family protein [Trichormus variabilis ARAD]MBC1257994.1 DUF1802 family protein [Trichormus variabilis V5]MBC1270574.1 DUF1802 family protein [Trichormus variabilis FSR]MBC1304959.1 DUF1802 family protein [Trichormus variabilis N2B]